MLEEIFSIHIQDNYSVDETIYVVIPQKNIQSRDQKFDPLFGCVRYREDIL